MNKSIFIAIDGNQIGKKIEQFILSNNLDDLCVFSDNVTSIVKNISELAGRYGRVYLSGGDNVLAEVMHEKLEELLEGINTISCDKWDYSIGIGESATDAYLALKYAKANNAVIVEYREKVFKFR